MGGGEGIKKKAQEVLRTSPPRDCNAIVGHNMRYTLMKPVACAKERSPYVADTGLALLWTTVKMDENESLNKTNS